MAVNNGYHSLKLMVKQRKNDRQLSSLRLLIVQVKTGKTSAVCLREGILLIKLAFVPARAWRMRSVHLQPTISDLGSEYIVIPSPMGQSHDHFRIHEGHRATDNLCSSIVIYCQCVSMRIYRIYIYVKYIYIGGIDEYRHMLKCLSKYICMFACSEWTFHEPALISYQLLITSS